MITVPLLSQRDPRWANIKLGYGVPTIGQSGCIITCLTSLSGGNDVAKTNSDFMKYGAYSQGNLTYWVNVPLALRNLNFVYRYNYYDNNIVSDYVYNKKIPVIVQVNAAPIGGSGDHYVLYVGDHKLMDPWTGTIRLTSDFPAQKGFILYTLNPSLTISQRYDKIKTIAYGSDSSDSKVAQIKGVIEAS